MLYQNYAKMAKQLELSCGHDYEVDDRIVNFQLRFL